MVKSALRMLALYMCFNGTGIQGGETTCILKRYETYIGVSPKRTGMVGEN